MPARSRTSFQKRQKELLRAEKQRDKAAKRLARKLEPKEDGIPEPEEGELTAADSEMTQEPEAAQGPDTLSHQ